MGNGREKHNYVVVNERSRRHTGLFLCSGGGSVDLQLYVSRLHYFRLQWSFSNGGGFLESVSFGREKGEERRKLPRTCTASVEH